MMGKIVKWNLVKVNRGEPRLLRRDTVKILTKRDQSEFFLEVEETLEQEKWRAISEEYKMFDFVRSLTLIATQHRPESIDEIKKNCQRK